MKVAHPDVQFEVQEVTTDAEMLRFTPLIAFPSLMIYKKLVCIGMFPSKEDILAWFETKMQDSKI